MRYCPACGARLETRCHEGRDRPTCPACGFVWYADPKVVVALLIRSEGRVLLGRRTNETGRGRWALPGGFVDRGEALETAARREALEELGVEIAIGPLLGLHSADGDPVVLAVYAATITAGTPRPGDDLDAVAYFAPDALPELAFARDGEIVGGAGHQSLEAGSPSRVVPAGESPPSVAALPTGRMQYAPTSGAGP